MALEYNPRIETPIFKPQPDDALDFTPSVETTTEPVPAPTLASGYGRMSGLSGADVPAPTGQVEGPYSKSISDMMIDIQARSILEDQGLDAFGRPIQGVGGMGGGIPNRQEFINSYFKENGNPLQINISAETDKIMNENIQDLWSSFFQGRVPFQGRLSGQQAKEWNSFLQAVYQDTYNRVSEDKQSQVQSFKFAMGEFSEYEEQARRGMELELKRIDDAYKSQREEQEKRDLFTFKEEYKRRHADPSKTKIQGELVMRYLNNEDLTDKQMDVMTGSYPGGTEGLRLLSGLMMANPQMAGAIWAMSKVSEDEQKDNGWSDSEKSVIQFHRMTGNIVKYGSALKDGVRKGMSPADILEIKDLKAMSAEMDKISESVYTELPEHIRQTEDKALKKHRIELWLRQQKGLSKDQVRQWLEYEKQIILKKRQMAYQEQPEL